MRAISLWQPWASAVALGSKRVETRHWSTDYRGQIAIHAAKRYVQRELDYYGAHWNWHGALHDLGVRMGGAAFEKKLPFGAIVAVATLADCRPTGSFTVDELDTPRRPNGEANGLYEWTERQMGNFEIGRFGWVFTDVQKLVEPVPFVGRQRFFNVPDELLKVK